ncbi:LytR/AlgR family response regulator transcription factor [Flagellimonas allohymeniacidonis]|uniref:Response regulator transcription factor n=1 Tax=Flagellimonas allohymeniacidonis TaxID=2517819 RepID=A0A4Q8QI77_9FLAO|nr:response regulator transcription factor [Allomuricauda hymeniacidonis]TAI48393.1 response regulator transcription factor [Allomuricauda hymeniacidonis]
MTCIIVEDQPPAQRILKKYIEDTGTLILKGTFSNALLAMEFLKSEPIDLVFLDIHLPKLSGLDFLKTLSNPPHVILTTAFSEYALESYELNVVDYLLKPFSFQRFLKAITKVSERKTGATQKEDSFDELSSPKKEIYIKSGYEHVKINIDDIHYITSDSDYTEIISANKKYVSSDPLHLWLEKLPGNTFCRIHRSYIINTDKIEKIVGNQICLKGGVKLPLGRAYKEDFMQKVLK